MHYICRALLDLSLLTVASHAIPQQNLTIATVTRTPFSDKSTPENNKIERHKTAITRTALSAPMYLLFTSGLTRLACWIHERHPMCRHITNRQIEDLISAKLVTPEKLRAAGLQA
ncbi:MAG: hypothetical protein ACI84R_001475 [Candidatus Azotimanducaceae bacterium]|jgi:hypothetical protein